MLKLIGIVTVLYVCYCGIDAVADKLEFWQPTSVDTRRSHKRRQNSEDENDEIRMRSNHLHEKSTLRLRANEKEIVNSTRHGKSNIESSLTNESDIDSKRSIHKTDVYKNPNKHDNKKHNPNSRERKHKHHESEKNEIPKMEESPMKGKKRKENKIHAKEKHQTVETRHDEEKNTDHIRTDSKHSKNHKPETDDIETKVKQHKSGAEMREDRTRYDKDKHKIGGPMRMPKRHHENKQGRVPDRSHVRERKSKSRSHKKDDDAHIRSTRLVPLSLMQQEEEGTPEGGAGGGGGGGHKQDKRPSYLSPYSTMKQMKEIIEAFPEANATFETIGRTAEYNDIVIIKVIQKNRDADTYFRAGESKYIDEVPEKKIIFIVHGLVVMGIKKVPALVEIENLTILLSHYLKHINKFDIFLIPMANPDGQAFNLNASPFQSASVGLWNKNMSPQDACPGVDVDRNFDVAWNGSRLMSSCSPLYPGPAAFSEVESKAIRDIFHYFGHKIIAYINVHASSHSDRVFKGEAILFPRGYTELQSDDDKYIDLRGEVDEAMKNASFQVMSVAVETLYNWYGRVTGSSVDYASTVYGIPFALEFAMQPYSDPDTALLAVKHIWTRVIDTTFAYIHKSLHSSDVRRK